MSISTVQPLGDPHPAERTTITGRGVVAGCSGDYLNQPTVSIATLTLDSGELDLTGATGFFGGMTVNLSMVYHLEVG